jgi:hypothetical protein
MKKTYFAPEMEVVDLNMQQVLLTGSLPLNDTTTVDDPEDILAPGLNIENELFGFGF